MSLSAMLSLLSSCGSSDAHKQAEQVHRSLTGATGDGSSTNPLCKLFAPTEVAAYENAPLKDPVDAAAGSGCQWLHREGSGSAMLQVEPSGDHQEVSSPGSRHLGGIGEEGFVEPYLGGWHAAAIASGKSINVMTSESSSEDKTVAFLREAISRYAKQGGG